MIIEMCTAFKLKQKIFFMTLSSQRIQDHLCSFGATSKTEDGGDG